MVKFIGSMELSGFYLGRFDMTHKNLVTTLLSQNAQINTGFLISSMILSKCFKQVVLPPALKAVWNE